MAILDQIVSDVRQYKKVACGILGMATTVCCTATLGLYALMPTPKKVDPTQVPYPSPIVQPSATPTEEIKLGSSCTLKYSYTPRPDLGDIDATVMVTFGSGTYIADIARHTGHSIEDILKWNEGRSYPYQRLEANANIIVKGRHDPMGNTWVIHGYAKQIQQGDTINQMAYQRGIILSYAEQNLMYDEMRDLNERIRKVPGDNPLTLKIDSLYWIVAKDTCF